jgi:hypothetical protein
VRKRFRRLRIAKETLRVLEGAGVTPQPNEVGAKDSTLCVTSATKPSCSYVQCDGSFLDACVQCFPAPHPADGT